MMIPKKESLILADKLVIYNNFAKNEDCEGRLLIELQIYPTPRIVWDFEIWHEQECDFPTIYENLSKNSFIGNSVRVEALSVLKGNMGGSASGSATKVIFGDPKDPAHTFRFCLTNTKFLEQSIVQDIFVQTVCEKRITGDDNNNAQHSRRTVGRFIEIPLNLIWSVRLEIFEESLNWLNSKQGNIGTYLTCIGELYQSKRSEASDNFPASLIAINIIEAQEILRNLCQLLS